MQNFADRLVAAIRRAGNACVVGLDPRIELMPEFIKSGRGPLSREVARAIIRDFHELVLDVVGAMVPVVKPQLAFFEQYGIGGMEAFVDTLALAKAHGLVTIADGKRNDIASTAEAYANAFLGESGDFSSDSMTVTPYLGRDGLTPFVGLCGKNGRGAFVVLKTSNAGSRDFQDQVLQSTGRPVYESVAAMIEELGRDSIGASGYSSIGAVVGATFPDDARRLRTLMPHAFFLVPGYGAQGADGRSAAVCFNSDGLGAVVSSSRGITYDYGRADVSRQEYERTVREKTQRMIEDVTEGIAVTQR